MPELGPVGWPRISGLPPVAITSLLGSILVQGTCTHEYKYLFRSDALRVPKVSLSPLALQDMVPKGKGKEKDTLRRSLMT
jgi:hypothetical protein